MPSGDLHFHKKGRGDDNLPSGDRPRINDRNASLPRRDDPEWPSQLPESPSSNPQQAMALPDGLARTWA